ncbi:MAG TPA: hypothetical protein VER37_06165 [Thermomicrobiales bacterium]|nr:hypothetical protein [Thermomicrobiales bacterium]
MDQRRFDALLRSFATVATSRRGAVRGLAGGGAAGLLGLLGFDDAAAGCVRAGGRCGDKKRCCRGTACKGGKCRCKTGLTACGGRCVNTKTSAANCGGCGKACDPGQTCANGTCKDSDGGGCSVGEKECRGACIPAGDCCTDGDCDGGKTCKNGTCTADSGPTCPNGQKECNGTCKECCGDGDCGGGKTCQNGTCACRYWERDCNGTCRECCGNQDCGPRGACNDGVCFRPALVEEKSDEVGFGKRIETKATLFRNDQLVVEARTINESWVAGLRGRVLVVVVDDRDRAIWVSRVFECRTRCSVPDVTCASQGLETFTENFPAHPEAGNVISKYASSLAIYHSDGPDPVTFRDQWVRNIQDAQDIAREIKELAQIVGL